MTRQQFQEQFFHQYFGMIADGAVQGRSGPELSVWIRTTQAKALAQLGLMYDALNPNRGAQPPNGKEVKREQEKPAAR